MKIGIVGVGVVGGACKFGFELLGHNVSVHDIALDTTLDDVLDTSVVYICVPTPRACGCTSSRRLRVSVCAPSPRREGAACCADVSSEAPLQPVRTA